LADSKGRLEVFSEEADDVVGLDNACHAALGIYYGQSVEVVLVEEFGQFILVQGDGAGVDACFSQRGRRVSGRAMTSRARETAPRSTRFSSSK